MKFAARALTVGFIAASTVLGGCSSKEESKKEEQKSSLQEKIDQNMGAAKAPASASASESGDTPVVQLSDDKETLSLQIEQLKALERIENLRAVSRLREVTTRGRSACVTSLTKAMETAMSKSDDAATIAALAKEIGKAPVECTKMVPDQSETLAVSAPKPTAK